MRPLINRAIWIQKPAVINRLARRILRFKLHPCFKQIPHFGNERMANILVLHHHDRFNRLARQNRKRHRTQRSKHLIRLRLPNRKKIHVQILARSQKLLRLRLLLIVAVIKRHRRIPCRPSVRSKRTFLRAVFLLLRYHPLHVTVLANLQIGLIEGQRRPL